MKILAYVIVACMFLVLAAGAAYTEMRRRQIEAQHKPTGTFRKIDGVRLHFVDEKPEGWSAGDPSVVFIHGASGNLLDPLLAFGSRFDGRVRKIFVDRPGHGFSERGPQGHSPRRQAELLAGLIRELGLGPTVAVGHSWGGSVVAELGLNHGEDVHGLAFLAPATHPWEGGVNWYYTAASLPVIGAAFVHSLTLPIAERMAPCAMRHVFSPNPVPRGYAERIGLPLLFRPRTFQANARDVASLHGHVSQVADSYSSIAQPAVVVTGDADAVVYAHIHSEGLARDLQNVELRVLEGAGHMPHHTHTDEVVDAIKTIMNKVVTTRTADVGEPSDKQPAD